MDRAPLIVAWDARWDTLAPAVMKTFVAIALALGLLELSAGCERSDGVPRAPAVTNPAEKPRTQRKARRERRPFTRGVPTAAPTAARDAAIDAAASVVKQPELLAADGGALGQTEDRPSSSSAFFRSQAELLFRAIASDDPTKARSFFFPRVAYRQVKAIADPDRDYDRRLLAAFDRDIHEYHKKLGKNPEQARFVELWVPEDGARWMKPGSEGNKLGYFRVLRSQLRYRDADGKDQILEVTSLISWRGEWYVVHVHGFG